MKLLPEDPRITAYALGEIEDPVERNAIKAAIEASPELQAAVAAIRDMGDLLNNTLAEEPAPELSEFEKAKLEAPGSEPKRDRLLTWPFLTSAAAIALLAFILVPQIGQREEVFSYQSPPLDDASVESELISDLDTSSTTGETLRYRTLDVSIPDKLIEGTSQPVKDVNLELAPELAPRLPMQSSDVGHADLSSSTTTSKQSSLMSYQEFKQQNSPESTIATEAVGGEAAVPSRIAPVRLQSKPSEASKQGDEPNVRSFLFGTTTELSSIRDHFSAQRPSLNEVVDSAREPEAEWSSPPVDTFDSNFNTEAYDLIDETDFRSPLVAPLSTFSIDVDTASYANVRRFLNQGQLPPADAVRIEEMINYFSYADAAPSDSLDEGGDPFAVHMVQGYAPWNTQNRLLRIALKGYEMPWAERPASNLVFLLDVSGSMNSENKLPLVKAAMQLLIDRLDARDRVAIVVYAGASGLALPSTTANNRETIEHAMNNLKAGGSTNAGAGIELAYATAREHFIQGGNNRVILCTDGDFNVGQTNRGTLADRAELAAEQGVSLSILGFGMGNLKDGMLEELSNKGKGTYAYIDSKAEARKVFMEDLVSNIFKIAKDVKIQVEFNPEQVKAYRLIGYENRRLKAEDFNNDKKKAGDIGPGHTVVALYEIVPVGSQYDVPEVDPLRYQAQSEVDPVDGDGEVATVKLRYKQPDGDTSQLITRSVQSDGIDSFDQCSLDFRFTAAVAAFGMRLSDSRHVSDFSFDQIAAIAIDAIGDDRGGHRSEFIELIDKASLIHARD